MRSGTSILDNDTKKYLMELHLASIFVQHNVCNSYFTDSGFL